MSYFSNTSTEYTTFPKCTPIHESTKITYVYCKVMYCTCTLLTRMEVETKVVHLFVKNKSRSVKVNSWRFLLVIVIPEMESVRIFSTRQVNFKIYADQPVSDRPGQPVFYRRFFVHCSMHFMKNF